MTRNSGPRPAEGEVRVQVAAVGLSALGTQLAGTIDAVARDSIGFARGDRVAFAAEKPATGRVIVAERDLIGVPADVSLDAAAGLFPCALLARTVVRQVHDIGSGDRVAVADTSALAPFIRAWIEQMGATVVNDLADATVTTADIRRARAWKTAHGAAQQAAADVFDAIRSGAFDAIEFSTPDQARQGSRSPVLLHPTEVTLAA
jgi:NADPH:quinone reductase-like Zn-dependent oxidoreductase